MIHIGNGVQLSLLKQQSFLSSDMMGWLFDSQPFFIPVSTFFKMKWCRVYIIREIAKQWNCGYLWYQLKWRPKILKIIWQQSTNDVSHTQMWMRKDIHLHAVKCLKVNVEEPWLKLFHCTPFLCSISNLKAQLYLYFLMQFPSWESAWYSSMSGFCFCFVQMDDVISQAQTTRTVLGSQRALFGDVQGKVKVLSDKFPIIRGLLGMW